MPENQATSVYDEYDESDHLKTLKQLTNSLRDAPMLHKGPIFEELQDTLIQLLVDVDHRISKIENHLNTQAGGD
jgi:hypothetical protein